MKVFILTIMALAMGVSPLFAEKFERDGYTIDAALEIECTGKICKAKTSGTVSGGEGCQLLSLDVLVGSDKGNEVHIHTITSRFEGPSPFEGDKIVNGEESWTIKDITTNCDCE